MGIPPDRPSDHVASTTPASASHAESSSPAAETGATERLDLPSGPGDLVPRLGDLVRAAREKQGMTRSALAEAARVSQPYISLIESGERLPRLEVANRIAEVVGLDPTVIGEVHSAESHLRVAGTGGRVLAWPFATSAGSVFGLRGLDLKSGQPDLTRSEDTEPGSGPPDSPTQSTWLLIRDASMAQRQVIHQIDDLTDAEASRVSGYIDALVQSRSQH